MKQSPCIVCKIVGALVIIGALNWGLVGILQFDLVAKIFGEMSIVSRVVYGLVGVAGLIKLVCCFKPCPCCGKTECAPETKAT